MGGYVSALRESCRSLLPAIRRCLPTPETAATFFPWVRMGLAAGDPTDVVLAALVAAERAFGADVNTKGFKVPRGVGVIQVRELTGH